MPHLTKLTTRTAACRLGAALAALALVAAPGSLAAQEDRQAQSVADRNAPEFNRRPIRVGSFDLFPSIDLDVNYNDNIFALPGPEIDDVLVTVSPKILLVKRRPDRMTRLNLDAGFRRYVDAISENSERFSANIMTRQGLGSGTEWRLGANASYNFEQRRDIASFNEASTPINFTTLQGNAGITQDLGPLRLSLDGSAKAVRYDGQFEQNGTVFDLSFRDFEIYRASVRGTFARSANQEFYVQITGDSRRFDVAPLFQQGTVVDFIDRSSKGGRLEAGYRRQVTELLYLDLRAGYLLQDFDDPTVSNVDGLAFSADLLWNATPLTSVRLSGVRQLDESIDPRLSGLVRTEARVQVEHELMRNIILIGRAGYSDFNQTGSPLDGEQVNLSASARYNFTRAIGFALEVEHFDRSGLNGFTQNTLTAGVTYNF